MGVKRRTKPLAASWRGCLPVVTALVVNGCAEPATDERRLRARQTALEDKDRDGFVANLSPDFLGQQRLRRTNVDGLLRLHFQRNERISVSLSDVNIQIMAGTAEVRFKALARGGSGLFAQRGRRVRMHTQWRKTDQGWRVVRAGWKDIAGGD